MLMDHSCSHLSGLSVGTADIVPAWYQIYIKRHLPLTSTGHPCCLFIALVNLMRYPLLHVSSHFLKSWLLCSYFESETLDIRYVCEAAS
jgi:hypothetical protein